MVNREMSFNSLMIVMGSFQNLIVSCFLSMVQWFDC